MSSFLKWSKKGSPDSGILARKIMVFDMEKCFGEKLT
jgi:hypothetical protein